MIFGYFNIQDMIMKNLLFILVIAFINLPLTLSGQAFAGNNKVNSTNEKSVIVYFDGASNEIVVNNPLESNKYLVQVFNLTGSEVVKYESIQNNIAKIPTALFRNGVYLVRVSPTPNQPSATFKIMVR